MLFTTTRHEPLVDRPFSEAVAQEVIERIAARAERELDPVEGLWPLDPADVDREGEGPDERALSRRRRDLMGARRARPRFGRPGARRSSRARILTEPDTFGYGAHGVWFGVAGVLAVAERHWPDPSRRDRLADLARASLDSPGSRSCSGTRATWRSPRNSTRGRVSSAGRRSGRRARSGCSRSGATTRRWAPGSGRSGSGRARHAASAPRMAWSETCTSCFGVARSSPPPAAREVERRAVETLTRLAVVEDGLANWPPVAGGPLTANDRIRVQWCHGAAGILISLWDLAPDDDAWGELLLAAGRLVWQAGPIRDEPGLCHGTAGNAYALLALWRRTGDEQWLERARAFAQHAATQVEERAERLDTAATPCSRATRAWRCASPPASPATSACPSRAS